jgi:hypothetical protein
MMKKKFYKIYCEEERGATTLSITSFNIMTERCYAESHFCWLSLMLFMLIVVMLSVVLLNVVMLSVVMQSVVMLSVVMLSVVMLSVVMLIVVMLSDVLLSVASPRIDIQEFCAKHFTPGIIYECAVSCSKLLDSKHCKLTNIGLCTEYLSLSCTPKI